MEANSGTILITGGSGFLGRALARRFLQAGRWRRVCIFSRGEHAQAQMFEDLDRHPALRMFIGDVREPERVAWALKGVDIVVHAAALKRIEVGHYNPGEMVKTNVVGTMNVAQAALEVGVGKVIGVSTDKAFQPISPYGLSKAMAESILLSSNNVAGADGPLFAVCRYGNVAGSTGSVIPRWRQLIAEDRIHRVVPVTNLECTRYWMTVDQAVDTVITTIDTATRDNALLIPKLPAFKIGDLARAMGATTRPQLGGLQPWEKMHEWLHDGECSATARRMSVIELQEALKNV